MFDQSSNSLPHVRDGKINTYAVTGGVRLASAPDIPTVDEAGVPGFHTSVWHGIWVPKATPAPVVAKLNAAIVEALADPGLRQRLTGPRPGDPAAGPANPAGARGHAAIRDREGVAGHQGRRRAGVEQFPVKRNSSLSPQKKLPAAAPKFPAQPAQGICYKPLRHSHEMAFESPSRRPSAKYPCKNTLPAGNSACAPAGDRFARQIVSHAGSFPTFLRGDGNARGGETPPLQGHPSRRHSGAFGPLLRYQSRTCSPVQNSTSPLFRIVSKMRRKYLVRCGAPMM
jgi:hypothetical protein